MWNYDPTAYYRQLQNELYRSTAARYNQIIDDIRDDIVRIEPFFMAARKVADLDRRREATMAQIPNLSPPERFNAQARIAENSLTIAWVHTSLDQRCASYRFAIEHLAVAEPELAAGEADRLLTELSQQIAANDVQVVAAPRFRLCLGARGRRHAAELALAQDVTAQPAAARISPPPARGAPSASGRAPAPARAARSGRRCSATR